MIFPLRAEKHLGERLFGPLNYVMWTSSLSRVRESTT